jgi:hypothetical protein
MLVHYGSRLGAAVAIQAVEIEGGNAMLANVHLNVVPPYDKRR